MLWIITDSRGRGLEDWAPEGTKITMRPGATLDNIILHIFYLLNSQHHHSLDILISAGINNITKKESNQLIFRPSFDVESFCHTINQLHASLIEHPSINSVAFTTISSCSLIKYINIINWPCTDSHQPPYWPTTTWLINKTSSTHHYPSSMTS